MISFLHVTWLTEYFFLKAYSNYYAMEEEINRQFNVFAVNMKEAYESINRLDDIIRDDIEQGNAFWHNRVTSTIVCLSVL